MRASPRWRSHDARYPQLAAYPVLAVRHGAPAVNLDTVPPAVAFGYLAGHANAARFQLMQSARRATHRHLRAEYVRQARLHHRAVMLHLAKVRHLTP